VLLSGRHLVLDGALVVSGSVLIGFIVAFLQLFLHEAALYNLHPDRRVNDVLCNLFVSGVAGMEVRKYRPIHWDHHRHLGTPMDTEISYFDPLNIRFLVEALLGIRALKVIALRRGTLDKEPQAPAGEESGVKPFTLVGGLVANLVLLSTLLYFHQWTLALAWVLGIAAWFPFFGALRQLLEHRDENADPGADYTKVAHGAIHRLFGDGLLASTLGGAGFNRHLLHHWDPQLSCTRLRELEEFLGKTSVAGYLHERTSTYMTTFRRLFQPVWK
jgi:fatty acid desaturase